MTWQDALFGFGGLFFAASMVPTLRDKRSAVPLATSIPTALILTAYVVAEWTINLKLAAVGGVFSAASWWLVALTRRPGRLYIKSPVVWMWEDLENEYTPPRVDYDG